MGRIGFDPDIDADAGLLQFAQAPAGDVREGVTDGDDDAGQAGFDQRTGARGGLTGVAAGFERHVGGGAAGELAIGELLERIDLGMRPAEAAMVTLGQEFAVANQEVFLVNGDVSLYSISDRSDFITIRKKKEAFSL